MPAETFRIIGAEAVIKTLQQLPPEIVSKNGGPIRKNLRKAAQVIRAQELANLEQIILAPNDDGSPNESTGLLAKNIVISRGKYVSGRNGERMILRVRNKAYPDTKGKRVSTAQVARLLEHGTEKRGALPFIRPAFDQKKDEATRTLIDGTIKDIASIQRKLERQNGVKR